MFEHVNDREYYAQPPSLDGYFGDDIAPGVYQSALGPANWDVDSYNFLMQLMHSVLLTWDSSGWLFPRGGAASCWRQYPERYAAWKRFLAQFAVQFRKGWIPTYSFVSDANEAAGRNLLRQTQAWGRWFDSTCAPNLAYTRTGASSRLSGLQGGLGVIPIIFYVAGAAAASAGTVVAAWLSRDEWDVGSYNAYMRQMHDTILAWDKLGWDTGCWKKHPARREMWQSFMTQFGAHYRRGAIPDYSYVSDSDEKPAREFMTRLAGWGEWLNATCGVETGDGPVRPEVIDEKDDFDIASALKWGALLTLGVVGLNLISGVRNVLPPR